ncbi:hypothetical protein [uncultured Jatrophihabitans sp.]|uniref:hypothetical protein n=1 Tax=uncultured Jatrophihabitans sp. TaxID=1610747 RepID=UPI0035CB7AFC
MRFDDRHEVVVTGSWTDEMAQAVESGVADRVVLNHALGYDERDLYFLQYLPIRELVILDRRITDLTPVYTLAPRLEFLDVEVDPATRVDVAALPNLRDLSANWVQVAETVSAGKRLRRLAVDGYQADDLAPLAGLRELSALSMRERPRIRSVNGLSEFLLLEQLSIFLAAGLVDVADLRGRDLLTILELEGCRKLASLADLAGCTALRVLNLAEGGELESAAPLAGLVRLEELYLYGTTKFLDGDLSPLAGLPRLQELRMQNRRHYKPSVNDIRAGLHRG